MLYQKSLLIDDITPPLHPDVFENYQMSFDNQIQIKENGNFTFEDEYLIFIVLKIFLPFVTYDVTSPLLHSIGSEDTIFDPDIIIYRCYFLKPWVSRRSGTFMCFIVFVNILNESPMEIFFSTCFPKDK
jgi:hypothetical protein